MLFRSPPKCDDSPAPSSSLLKCTPVSVVAHGHEFVCVGDYDGRFLIVQLARAAAHPDEAAHPAKRPRLAGAGDAGRAFQRALALPVHGSTFARPVFASALALVVSVTTSGHLVAVSFAEANVVEGGPGPVVAWQASLAAAVFASPCVVSVDGAWAVVVATVAGTVHVRDAQTGTPRWTVDLGSPVFATPVCLPWDPTHLFVLGHDGTICTVSLGARRVVAQQQLTDDDKLVAAPWVLDAHRRLLLVLSARGVLHVLEWRPTQAARVAVAVALNQPVFGAPCGLPPTTVFVGTRADSLLALSCAPP